MFQSICIASREDVDEAFKLRDRINGEAELWLFDLHALPQRGNVPTRTNLADDEGLVAPYEQWPEWKKHYGITGPGYISGAPQSPAGEQVGEQWSDADLVEHFAAIRVEHPESGFCPTCGALVPDGAAQHPFEGKGRVLCDGAPRPVTFVIDNIGRAWIEAHFAELARLLADGARLRSLASEEGLKRLSATLAEKFCPGKPHMPGVCHFDRQLLAVLTEHFEEKK